jgi:hypothetical protein
MKNLLLYISFIFSFFSSISQDFVFKSYVDQNNISTDDYIRFTVESSERVQLNNLNFKDFIIKQGPYTSSSSQTTIINGKFKSQNEYKSTFIIAPKNTGTLSIESIKVNYNGKDYQTKKITVNVSKGQQNTVSSNNKKTTSKNSNSKLFAKITCSNYQPYIGENLIVKYKIYQSSYHIRNLEITDYDLPMINDFWTELIEPKNKQWKEEQEIINGISFRVFTLKKEIISPQKSGKLFIPSFEVTTVINRDFFNRGTSKIIKSNQPVINVKKLPANAPKSFKGQVGKNYKMDVNLSKLELQVDEALDLELIISGSGNLKQIKMPTLNFPKDMEKYPEEIKSKISLSENGISGRKKMNQLLIPRFHGDYEIPTIEFCYFDVTRNKYKILKHPGFKIKVSKGTNQSLSSSSAANSNTINKQEDVELINENIHHIKIKTKLYDYSDPIFGSKLYWTIIFSIPIGLIFLLIILSNKNRFKDKEKIKVKKIIKKVNQEFNNLNNNIDQISVTEFYKEISKLWNIYLTNKYQIKLSELSRDKIKEILRENSVSSDDISLMDKILNNCEMAQYSPLTNQLAKESLEESQNLIQKFEKNAG